MTAVESWIRIEKKLMAASWKLDSDQCIWSSSTWIVDFSDLPNLRIMPISQKNDLEFTIPAKELKLIADWIDGYWTLTGQLKKRYVGKNKYKK